MVHADLICVPQLMSGEQALAAHSVMRWFDIVRIAARRDRMPVPGQ